MSYYTTQDARDAFERQQRSRPVEKAARQLLSEEAAAVRPEDHFNIFLSHCMKDAELVVGVKTLLEEQGLTVYVDWIDDQQLDRGRVTPATADLLRRRMRASDSMLFATSVSSPDSKWMPWELGYFDGFRPNRIAILPLVAVPGGEFRGQEYLGLYPVVEKLRANGQDRAFITPGQGSHKYRSMSDFRAGATTFSNL